jgi:hypothetical protein
MEIIIEQINSPGFNGEDFIVVALPDDAPFGKKLCTCHNGMHVGVISHVAGKDNPYIIRRINHGVAGQEIGRREGKENAFEMASDYFAEVFAKDS